MANGTSRVIYGDGVDVFKFEDLDSLWDKNRLEYEDGGELPLQLIARPRGFLQHCVVFTRNVNVLVVPYHECMHTQLTRLCHSRLEVESATIVSLSICGVIRLMCCAAGEWELRLSPWRLRRVSVICVPLLLNWVGMVCDSDMTPPRRVQVAFESFIGELGEFTELLQSGGWFSLLERTIGDILLWWSQCEGLPAVGAVDDLQCVLKTKILELNETRRCRREARHVMQRTMHGSVPEELTLWVQSFL